VAHRSLAIIHRTELTTSVEKAGLRSCRLCGGRLSTVLYATDLNYGTVGQFRIGACERCSLNQTEIERESFQESDYPDSYARDRSVWNKWGLLGWRARRLIATVAVSKEFFGDWYRLGAPPGRLLDVGTGNGSYPVLMTSRGWKCDAIEPDHRAAEVAKRRGVEVFGDIDSLVIARGPGGRYDAITFTHVVEHVPNPFALLHSCKSLLAAEGKLLVIVPNFDSIGRIRFGRYWYPLDVPRHLWHFTESTLSSTLEKCGYKVLRVRYNNQWDDVIQTGANLVQGVIPTRIRNRKSVLLFIGILSAFANILAVRLLAAFGIRVQSAMILSAAPLTIPGDIQR
jgi:2-polyprenyl-3-methyl-5-hydroxy-6-metoxy-1,4-benzoquinol methylase